MNALTLRTATLADAPALTDLALRAKASWGYDAAFMEACREELTVTPNMLAAWRVWVAELDGVVAGMVALDPEGEAAHLEFFFVDPKHQGLGIGRALMRAFTATCRDLGFTRVEVDADPNAEEIYRRMGYRTIGYAPSSSIPGRMLPRMERRLD